VATWILRSKHCRRRSYDPEPTEIVDLAVYIISMDVGAPTTLEAFDPVPGGP